MSNSKIDTDFDAFVASIGGMEEEVRYDISTASSSVHKCLVSLGGRIHVFYVDSDALVGDLLDILQQINPSICLSCKGCILDAALPLTHFIGHVLSASGLGLGGSRGKNAKKKDKVQKKEVILKTTVKKLPPPRKVVRPQADKTTIARSKYFTALRNPFLPLAEGAKYCSGYAFPTVSYKIRHNIPVVTSTSTTAATLILRADPFCSVIDYQQWSGLSSVIVGASCTPYVNNQYFYPAVSYAAYSGGNVPIMNGRLVACGFRIRNDQPALSATGRIYIAPFPQASRAVGPNQLNNVTFVAGDSAAFTLFPLTSVTASSSLPIMDLPGAVEIGVTEMVNNELTLICKPTSPDCMKFKTMNQSNNLNGTQFVGLAPVTSAGGVSGTNVDTLDSLEWGSGFGGWVVRFEGLPSTGTPVCSIELIMHFEGEIDTPVQSGGFVPTGAQPVLQDYVPWDDISKAAMKLAGAAVQAGANTLLSSFDSRQSRIPRLRN